MHFVENVGREQVELLEVGRVDRGWAQATRDGADVAPGPHALADGAEALAVDLVPPNPVADVHMRQVLAEVDHVDRPRRG